MDNCALCQHSFMSLDPTKHVRTDRIHQDTQGNIEKLRVPKVDITLALQALTAGACPPPDMAAASDLLRPGLTRY